MPSADLLTRIPLVAGFRESAELLVRQAFTSRLTGLANGAAFESVATAYDRTLEAGFAVAFVDLTGFKDINDRHGHAVGDICISEAGGRLGRIAEEVGGFAFHISGDEFVALFAVDRVAAFERGFLKDLAGFEILLAEPKGAVPVRATCGVAIPEDAVVVLGELKARAEKACKHAKRTNRATLAWGHAIASAHTHDLRWRCGGCAAQVQVVIDDNGGDVGSMTCPRCATPRASS